MPYEAGQNAQKSQKVEERIVEKGARQRPRVFGLYLDAFQQRSLRQQCTAWLNWKGAQFYAACLTKKLERRWSRVSKSRQLFFGLTPLSRISKSLWGKTPSETTGLRAGKQAEIARRLVAGSGEFPAKPRSCSGAMEKDIVVHIARRFKRQGHSWTRSGADHLAQLLWFPSRTSARTRWWHETGSAKIKVRLVSLRPRHQPVFKAATQVYSLFFSLTSKAVNY